jgi:branched-subunit amino acid ABC-type transport system permease component
MVSLDLAVNAVVARILLGGFYAAVTVGVTISFGMLDIVNIAHPAFIMLGSCVAYSINSSFGFDPILIGIVMAPLFFLLGTGVNRIYYYAFERRGEEPIRGLAFFFGLLFVGEVALILVFGVDYRFVEAPYIGSSRPYSNENSRRNGIFTAITARLPEMAWPPQGLQAGAWRTAHRIEHFTNRLPTPTGAIALGELA